MSTTSRPSGAASDGAPTGRARLRGTRGLAVAVVTASLLAAGGARADAQWSAPTPVESGSFRLCCAPALVFTGDGHALATVSGSEGASILAAAPGTSAFRRIGRAALIDAPVPYGRNGVAYLRRAAARRGATATRLGVSLGRVPGSLGRFRPLARFPGVHDPTARVAADRRGNLAVAWLQPGRGPGAKVRVALGRSGGAFGRPTTVGELITGPGERDQELLDVAYGANGDLVVAFESGPRGRPGLDLAWRDLRLAVRVKRPGAGFGPIQTFGSEYGAASISTAVAPTGRAVIAWGTQDGGLEVERPWRVRAAVLRAGARRFSRPQLLDRGRVGRPVAGVHAAIAPEGTATVAWSGVAASRQLPWPVRVARAGRTGLFSATQQLAPNGAVLGLTSARDGATTVLWGSVPPGLVIEEDPGPEQILASHRPAGSGAFAAAEPVSPRRPDIGTAAALALDPRTARLAGLWTVGDPFATMTALYSTRLG